MAKRLVVLMAAVGPILGAPARGDDPDLSPAPTLARQPVCDRPDDLRLALDPAGPLRIYLDRVTTNWLLPAPAANPAMLAMFRDRDRPPYRDLLPWSGEFAGKYLTGATQVLHVLPSEELDRHLERFVADLVASQDEDGYLGPFPREHRLTGHAPNVGPNGGPTWDAWGHYHALLGLLLWHDRTGDPNALRAARRIGDLFVVRFLDAKSSRFVDTGSTEMNLAPAHGLCRLYRRTGEPRFLELARQIVDEEFAATDAQGAPLAGDYLRRGLANEPFYRTPKPRWESLHPIMALAELAWITGDERYATAFDNLWWSIVAVDRHNTGGFSSGEQAQGNPYHPGAIETCCTIAWMAMTVERLRLTGDSIAADELELSTYNAALGQIHPSGRWSTYNTPMDGRRLANSHEINFQCRPGSPELNCCSVNAARGLGLFGEWALVADSEGIRLNAYEPCDYDTTLADGTALHLDVSGRYPIDPNVVISVSPAKPARFTLRLRLPNWSAQTEVTIDGRPIDGAAPGTYLALDRTWEPGQSVRISLDFSPRIWTGARECAGKASVYRGPILLAYDPRFNPDHSDPEGPVLDADRLGELRPVLSPPGVTPGIVLAEVPDTQGRRVILGDFGSAGVDGTAYRSWLRIDDATPGPREWAWPGRNRLDAGGTSAPQ